MNLAPAQLFSGKAEDYASGRPGYDDELVRWAQDTVGARPGQRIADIGCGTGQLAEAFVRAGYHVVGVDPSADMLASAELALAGSAHFSTCPGTAEETTLADHSVAGIVVGTAFHWFDPAACAAEFNRILRRPGWVMLAANERDPRTATDVALGQLLERFSGAADTRMRNLGDCAPAAFLGQHAQHRSRPTVLHLDKSGFTALVWSRSYMPRAGEPRRNEAQALIDAFFAEHADAADHVLRLSYRTVTFATAGFPSAQA